jgi:hypothetical protein
MMSAIRSLSVEIESEESVMRIAAPILVVAALASSSAYAKQTIFF